MAKRYHNSGGMISNGGSHANMPEGVKKKNYPTTNYIGGTYEDDIAGIDKQINEDVKGVNRQGNKTEKF